MADACPNPIQKPFNFLSGRADSWMVNACQFCRMAIRAEAAVLRPVSIDC
jgi:hypothetical protein